MSMTVRRSFSMATQDHGKKVVKPATNATIEPVQGPEGPTGRVPRITRLMALAIKFDGYLRDGLINDYAELARLGHVSRARITQIMDLTLLSPDIQDDVLSLPRTEQGRDPIRERHLRAITAEVDWREQKQRWEDIRSEQSASIV